MRLRKIVRVFTFMVACLVLLAAAPIIYVEASCRSAGQETRATPQRAFHIDDPGYRRAEGDSYLTYPEWYIVHAYADLAGVTRQSSESAFDYLASIGGFWTSLCSATRTASSIGPVTTDQKVTNYIIGLSFSLEMGLQGFYERTIGALTVLARGGTPTPEDAFNLRFLEDYAAFLQQTPWYEYPFGSEFLRFWRETPWSGSNFIRRIERRFALSLEYGVKAGYGRAMGWLAGVSPADLLIGSVLNGKTKSGELPANVTRVRDLGDGAVLVQTPRYQAFTEILRTLGRQQVQVLEIAGNTRILVTVIAPEAKRLQTTGAREIFALPIQSRPGWRRLGLDTEVPALTALIESLEGQGAAFEHAYDY